jgi:ribonuclease D
LKCELTAKGRLTWVEEESELLSEVRAADREGEPFYSRFKGASRMDPRTLAVLEELLRYRDEKARLTDRPPFKVLPGETLRVLSEKKPKNPAELKGIPGLPQRSVDRHGKDLLKAVAEGCALPDDKLPRIYRPARPDRDPHKEERYKKLKQWRETKAQELGISAGILMNNNLLEIIAKVIPRDISELDGLPTMRNWQKREFGDELLAVLR